MAFNAQAAADKPSTPDEALAALRAGNERFCQGVAIQRDLLAEAKATSGAQKPFAAILSCIDSRTSSELVFDQGIGDVFNARMAGNIVDDDVLGSLEFATKAAGAKFIAVIGHSGCGAVIGAINKVEMGHLTGLLDKIEPAVDQVSAATKTGEKPPPTPGLSMPALKKCATANEEPGGSKPNPERAGEQRFDPDCRRRAGFGHRPRPLPQVMQPAAFSGASSALLTKHGKQPMIRVVGAFRKVCIVMLFPDTAS